MVAVAGFRALGIAGEAANLRVLPTSSAPLPLVFLLLIIQRAMVTSLSAQANRTMRLAVQLLSLPTALQARFCRPSSINQGGTPSADAFSHTGSPYMYAQTENVQAPRLLLHYSKRYGALLPLLPLRTILLMTRETQGLPIPHRGIHYFYICVFMVFSISLPTYLSRSTNLATVFQYLQNLTNIANLFMSVSIAGAHFYHGLRSHAMANIRRSTATRPAALRI